MGSECGPGGSQSRAVWCAHSEGWTTLHTNCPQAERPDNRQSCFRVCDWHKELYDWQLGAWNQCVPVSQRSGASAAGMVPPRPDVCQRGEEGIQTREVGCVHMPDAAPAEDAICEYFEPKPRLEQACLIPCPQDCIVSPFSDWTICSKTCGTGLQNRVRNVLAPPLFGGSACPNLTEFRTCQPGPCEGEESLYSLKVGPWGTCTPAPPTPPLLQTGQSEPAQQQQHQQQQQPLARQARHTTQTEVAPESEAQQEPSEETQPGRKNRRERKNKKERKERKERKARKERKERKERQDRTARQDRQAKKQKKRERLRERVKERGKVKDPETRELIKKKRTRNRQNRQGGRFWDLQVGYQIREVMCVHKNGNTAALR